MRKFTLAFSRNDSFPVVPELSDLVALGILPKQISEFTNDDIGTIINIPYNDESGKISLNNGCMEFEVVGVNHHKDINDESKPTITLMSKNILRYAAFDAKEPNNILYDDNYGGNSRAEFGNNRWSQSNIRQWLNSSRAANSWFSPQHEYDEAPTIDKVSNEAGAYADEPGFLAGFSANILQHFTDITNITSLCNADGGGSETTIDKVFLASYTEMGYGSNNNGVAEGTHLSIKYPNNNSRIKQYNGSKKYYLTRSPYVFNPYYVRSVDNSGEGHFDSILAYDSTVGLAPLVVLH